jgi:hypothetical protein
MTTAVYTVANDRFFVGLLGLVSSLRINGHDGSILVVDSGLQPPQIEALSDHVSFIPAPPDLPSHYLKAVGPLAQPADAMLFVDADMLCVRPLTGIVDSVRAGSIVAFEDIGRAEFSDALWAKWDDRLALGGLEPSVYVNGGFVAGPRDLGVRFFEGFKDAMGRIDPAETHIDALRLDMRSPFAFADQDVINALLASAPFRSHLDVLPYDDAPHPPFRGITLDSDLTCVGEDGRRPFFLHHTLQKPWLEALPSNPYTTLLVNYIHRFAMPGLDTSLLPVFLRPGRLGPASRVARSTRGHVRRRVRGKLGLRPRIAAFARWLETDRAA